MNVKGRYRTAFPIVLLAAAVLLAYANSFSAPFQFDDGPNIAENPLIRHFDLFFSPDSYCSQFKGDAEQDLVCRALPTRIVGYFTFALNYRLHGPAVEGYHAVNIAIHFANAVLLYLLAVLLFRAAQHPSPAGRPAPELAALCAAALFAVHPLQTQAVTYIVQRFTSLAAFFYLLSAVLYVRWMLLSGSKLPVEGTGRTSSQGKAMLYLSSIFCAVLAMKTKQTAFTLPLAILMLDRTFFGDRQRGRLLRILPFLATMLIVPLDILGTAAGPGEILGDIDRTTRLLTSISRYEYLMTQFRVIMTYLRLLFLPVGQNLDYDYAVSRSLLDPSTLVSFLFLAGLAGGAFVLLWRSRQGDPVLRVIAFGILWFFLALSVESSVIPIADVIFEHRMYLPSAGILLSLAAAGALLVEHLSRKHVPYIRGIAAVIAVSLAVILTAATYSRNAVWSSSITLWSDVVRKSPQKFRGLINLAVAYKDGKEYEKATEVIDRAVALYPDAAHGYFCRALISIDRKDYPAALQDLNRALEIDPKNAKAYSSRGLARFRMGTFGPALDDFAAALELDPGIASVYNTRGVYFLERGEYDAAYRDFIRALSLVPDEAEHHTNLASVYYEKGELSKAIDEYTQAVALRPELLDAYYNRGLAYRKAGRPEEALTDFTEVITKDPGRPGAFLQRGKTLFMLGRTLEASEDLRTSCRLGSDEACSLLQR